MTNSRMREIQGYAIAIDRILFVTRVFQAEDGEGFQFNIRFAADLMLAPRFPTRHEAELERELLLKQMRGMA